MRALAAAWLPALRAGLGLALVEVALVLGSDRHLFLSSTELVRYGLLAPLAVSALALVVSAVGLLGLRALGERERLGFVVLATPLGGWVLWLLTSGRRVRDLPGRAVLVAAVAFVAAWTLGGLARRLREAHAAEPRRPRLAIALAVAAIVALALDMYVLRRLYPAFHWTLGAASVALAVASASFLGSTVRRPGLWHGLAGGVVVGALAVLVLVGGAPNVRFAVEQAAPLSGKALALVSAAPGRSDGAAASAPVPGLEGAPGASRATGVDLRGRDVLLITIDALRADRLAAYGGTGLTPAMDRLADGSAVFLRAYTPTPHTSYALSSLMTGKLMREVMALSEASGTAVGSHPTLPQVLRRHGHRTAAFFPPAIFFVDADRFAWLREDNLGFEYVKAMYATADTRVAQLESYLEQVDSGRPLFAWVHLFEPHEPYEPPEGMARSDRPVDRYDGEVRVVDAAVERLVAAFRAARADATVILTSDHGEEFGEHGGHHHGTTLFDEQLRVPLLWSSPGRVAPRRIDAPVETIDIATSLLSALGVPREARMRGDDLGPLLGGGEAAEGMLAYGSIEDSRMVTDGRLKLICDEGGGRCRLFDLEADPDERRDVSEKHPRERDLLAGRLASLVASVPRFEALALDEAGWPEALARARLGDVTAAPEVVPLLSSERDSVRAAAARAVGELAVGSARTVVAELCERDPSADVRAEAAVAALRLGEEAGVTHVRALLPAGGERARRAALALADAGHSDGAELLAGMAADDALSEAERVAAITALARVGNTAQARVLLPLLDDVRLRPHVARTLGAIGDDAAADALSVALQGERYPEARRAEARALIARGRTGAALSEVRRFLGTGSSLPDGVGLLLEAGALARASGAGADLRSTSAVQRGAWECGGAGCRPGSGASVRLPARGAPRGPVMVVLRAHVEGTGKALRVGGEEHWLNAGANEVSVARDGAEGEIRVSADAGVWLEAVAVVPVREDVAPPRPEPWGKDGGT